MRTWRSPGPTNAHDPARAADLLAVDGDPSVRIEDLRSVRVVIKGGRTVVQNGVVL